MDKKTCRKCNTEKALSDFYRKKDSRDGRHSYCKKCAVAGAKKHYRDNREEVLEKMNLYNRQKTRKFRRFIGALKSLQGCAFCPENDPCCMDFHHTDDDKESGIAELVQFKNLSRLIKEINKCVCVCSNCHRKIHAGRLTLTKEVPKMNLLFDEVKQMYENLPS